MPKFYTSINLNNNQLQNVSLNPQASTPSTYAAGLIYFDTNAANTSTYNRLIIRNSANGAWLNIPYSGSIVNADISSSAAITVGKLDTTSVRQDTIGAATSTISAGTSGTPQKIQYVADPTADNDAANKKYVDAAVANLNVHSPVQVATTGVLGTPATAYTAGSGGGGIGAYLTVPASSSTLTIDGVTLSSSDTGKRILVKNQGASYLLQNGVYYLDSFPTSSTAKLIRDTDYDGSVSGEVANGDYIFVIYGNTQKSTAWIQSGTNPLTVGTSDLTFTQFTQLASYTASNGVTLVGGTDFQLDSSVAATLTGTQTLTNKTLTSPKLSGSSTGYTIFASNNSGATNYTITFPDATGTVALTSGTTINGTSVTLGTTNTITAAAGTLTGTTLNSTVVSSSLTSVGTIATGVWNGTDIAVADGGTGGSTASSARTNLAAQTTGSGNALATKYAGPVTNDTAGARTITHNLGTRDVTVQVYETSGGDATNQVFTDVAVTGTETVTVTFAIQDSAVYRVVVTG